MSNLRDLFNENKNFRRLSEEASFDEGRKRPFAPSEKEEDNATNFQRRATNFIIQEENARARAYDLSNKIVECAKALYGDANVIQRADEVIIDTSKKIDFHDIMMGCDITPLRYDDYVGLSEELRQLLMDEVKKTLDKEASENNLKRLSAETPFTQLELDEILKLAEKVEVEYINPCEDELLELRKIEEDYREAFMSKLGVPAELLEGTRHSDNFALTAYQMYGYSFLGDTTGLHPCYEPYMDRRCGVIGGIDWASGEDKTVYNRRVMTPDDRMAELAKLGIGVGELDKGAWKCEPIVIDSLAEPEEKPWTKIEMPKSAISAMKVAMLGSGYSHIGDYIRSALIEWQQSEEYRFINDQMIKLHELSLPIVLVTAEPPRSLKELANSLCSLDYLETKDLDLKPMNRAERRAGKRLNDIEPMWKAEVVPRHTSKTVKKKKHRK